MRIIQLTIILLLACLPFAAKAEGQSTPDKKAELFHVLPTDHVIGDRNAPITVVEYASLSCSHCAHFHKEILPVLKKEYIDKGKVRLVYRDFPLNPPALYASMLTHCVDDAAFETLLGVLFKTQESWAYHRNYLEILTNIAKLSGQKAEDIDACFQNKQLEDTILEGRLKASNILEVKSTPSFFVDGVALSNASVAGFSSLFDKKLSVTEK